MKMKRMLSLLLCVAMVFSCGVTAFAAENPTVIEIFHTNDVHGAAMEATGKDGTLTNIGFARVKAYMDAQQADGKLLVDAGDSLQGLPFATITKGDTMAQLVKAMNYTAMAAGNHDFDYGTQRLLELQKKYDLPVVSANVIKNGKQLFTGTMIKEIGGVKVGIFGLSTPETAYKTNPANVKGISFGTEKQTFDAAKAAVKELRGKGAQVVIALTHLGSVNWAQPSSLKLAEMVTGIDLIIDGHSHSALDGGIKVGNTIITSTGDSLKNLGVVTITVAADKTVTITPKLVSAAQMQTIQPDAEIAALTTKLNDALTPELSKVVVTSPMTLDGEREHVRSESTNLGRLIAHSMLAETGADIAMLNGGSIRATIEKGAVTRGNMIAVLPFGNRAVTVKAKGSAIRQTMMGAMVAQSGGFPQFAGMTVTATAQEKKKADGATYIQYIPETITVNGKPLDDNKTYTVAINDYMYAGGDEVYKPLANGKILNEYGAQDEILIAYLPKANVAKIDSEQVLILSGKTAAPVTEIEKPMPNTGRIAWGSVAFAPAA